MKLLAFIKKLFNKEAQTEILVKSTAVETDVDLKKPAKKEKSAKKVKVDTTGLE